MAQKRPRIQLHAPIQGCALVGIKDSEVMSYTTVSESSRELSREEFEAFIHSEPPMADGTKAKYRRRWERNIALSETSYVPKRSGRQVVRFRVSVCSQLVTGLMLTFPL